MKGGGSGGNYEQVFHNCWCAFYLFNLITYIFVFLFQLEVNPSCSEWRVTTTLRKMATILSTGSPYDIHNYHVWSDETKWTKIHFILRYVSQILLYIQSSILYIHPNSDERKTSKSNFIYLLKFKGNFIYSPKFKRVILYIQPNLKSNFIYSPKFKVWFYIFAQI